MTNIKENDIFFIYKKNILYFLYFYYFYILLLKILLLISIFINEIILIKFIYWNIL